MGPYVENEYNPNWIVQSVPEYGGSKDPPKKSLGAAATVALPFLWEIAKTVYQHYVNKHNEQAAKDAATLAYDRQVEQWNRENKYNSPSSMLGRYAQAGLNPALIYGGSGAIAGNAGGLSEVSPSSFNGRWSTADLASPAEIAQVQANRAYIENLESMTRRNQISADNDTKRTDAQVANFAANTELSFAQAKKALADVDVLQEEARNLGKKWILMDKEERLKNYEIQVKEKTWESEVEMFSTQLNISKAEAEFASRYFLARCLDLEGDAHYKESMSKLTDKQFEQLSRTIDSLVEIVKNQEHLSDNEVFLSDFIKGHTNNYEYWLQFVIKLLSKAGEGAEDVLKTAGVL